jgi:hypothetical protein
MPLKLSKERTASKIKEQLILKSTLINSKQLDQLKLNSHRLFKKKTLQRRLGINLFQITWLEPKICQMVFLEEQQVETKEHRKALVHLVTITEEDQIKEILETHISLFKSKMIEINQPKGSTSTKIPRCNP